MLYPLSYEGGDLYVCRSEGSCLLRGSGLLVGVPVACPCGGERRFIRLSRVALGLGSRLPDGRDVLPKRGPGCSHVIPIRIAPVKRDARREVFLSLFWNVSTRRSAVVVCSRLRRLYCASSMTRGLKAEPGVFPTEEREAVGEQIARFGGSA
jgi:hypothetical protein